MKKIIITIFIFVVSISIFAQPFDISVWNNLRNSSFDIDNNLEVRFETIEMEEILFNTHLYYLDNQNWIESDIENINNLSFSSTIPYNENQTTKYRLKIEADSLVYLMPSFIEDTFPTQSSLMAEVVPEPTDDCIEPACEYSDLTGQYFAFSENKFYSGLTNSVNDYPLNNGGWVPTEYYIYVTALFNPETVLEDTVAYAMINAQIGIPGVLGIEPGVYKISNLGAEMDLENFELLGDIETTTVDDMLIMQCDIETITSDEQFGEWPNMTKTLGMMSFTGFFNISDGEVNFPDFTYPSALNFDQGIIEPFTNTLPVISEPLILEQAELQNISVNYFDENANFPLTAKIIFDNSTEINFVPTSLDYNEVVSFELLSPSNWETAVIQFSDNNIDFVELDISNTSIEENDSPLYVTELTNYPNPFNPKTTINFNLQNKSDVLLEIYNIKGEKVTQLINQNLVSGEHSVIWNGENELGKKVSSGMYFIKLNCDNEINQKKILLLK